MNEKYPSEYGGRDSHANYDNGVVGHNSRPATYDDQDVFGHEEGHDVR